MRNITISEKTAEKLIDFLREVEGVIYEQRDGVNIKYPSDEWSERVNLERQAEEFRKILKDEINNGYNKG